MEFAVPVFIVVAIATQTIRPISGQGWTYQSIGEGWMSDAAMEKEEEIHDYRFISYKSLLASGAVFQDVNLVSFVQLVVDETRDQLLVGGRDVLLRLHLDNLTELERADWSSDNETSIRCVNKGQTEETCRNFIRVLILHDSSVFTCGTNAFDPKCTWRHVNSLAESSPPIDGRGICPFSPSYNATALISSEGNIYAATVIDFSARDPVITRRSNSSSLRTMRQDSKWLNEPNFVSAYEIKNFVYFFFRETAVEYINCGKKIYSRVGRVCKNDKGGAFSLEYIWTSYHKARLNCSLPGNFPFYFDDLQGTFHAEDDDLIYAVFTTPPNSIPGSAVCVYNLTAITHAFDGPFKFQESPTAAWLMQDNHVIHGKCEKPNSNSKRSSEQSTDLFTAVKKYQLMDRAVMPREVGPIIMRENERWTHIVVDIVPTKRSVYDILFLATEDGKVRKMVRFPGTDRTCLIEEIKIVANGHPRPVKNMKISSAKGAIYISTEGELLKVPVERCHRFTDSKMCLNAQDPYCGWHTQRKACTPPPDNNVHSIYWEQDFKHCPVLDYQVDGGWSSWSEWSSCSQVGPDPAIDRCWCRSRACDHPKPSLNGRPCGDTTMEVTNCTVHGGWTQWSAWSACSRTCGMGERHRTRQCGNPSPRFGGSDCPGKDRETDTCPDNVQCPLVAVDGSWSSWSGWSTCTTNCNGGIQTRKRSCDRPPPDRGGILCIGNREEWRMCNTHRCTEISKISPWTDWIQTNRTAGGYFQQRFRFTCRANVETSKDIKTSFAKSEAQFCFNNNKGCYKPRELTDSITSIDTFTAVDRVLKNYCRQRQKLFKKYCNCRTLGVFLVCQKCGFG